MRCISVRFIVEQSRLWQQLNNPNCKRFSTLFNRTFHCLFGCGEAIFNHSVKKIKQFFSKLKIENEKQQCRNIVIANW